MVELHVRQVKPRGATTNIDVRHADSLRLHAHTLIEENEYVISVADVYRKLTPVRPFLTGLQVPLQHSLSASKHTFAEGMQVVV